MPPDQRDLRARLQRGALRSGRRGSRRSAPRPARQVAAALDHRRVGAGVDGRVGRLEACGADARDGGDREQHDDASVTAAAPRSSDLLDRVFLVVFGVIGFPDLRPCQVERPSSSLQRKNCPVARAAFASARVDRAMSGLAARPTTPTKRGCRSPRWSSAPRRATAAPRRRCAGASRPPSACSPAAGCARPTRSTSSARTSCCCSSRRCAGGRSRIPARLGGFVLGICRNLALDRVRQRERRDALWQQYGAALADLGADTPAPGDAPSYEIIHLEDCLSRCPSDGRDVVRLAYAEARSHGRDRRRARPPAAANARVLRHRTLHALRELHVEAHRRGRSRHERARRCSSG